MHLSPTSKLGYLSFNSRMGISLFHKPEQRLGLSEEPWLYVARWAYMCVCVCKVILLLSSTRDIRYQRSELSEEPWLYVARWAYVCM